MVLWSGAHLQRQTGGRVQGFEPPAAFPVELQQVGVVLPAERRVEEAQEEEKKKAGQERQGGAAEVQPRATLPPAGWQDNCSWSHLK